MPAAGRARAHARAGRLLTPRRSTPPRQDGNALREGARVTYRPGYDQRAGKARAEEITGAYHDPSRPPMKMPGAPDFASPGVPSPGFPAAAGGGSAVRGPPPGEPPAPPGKMMGTVKSFNMAKGFGFIIPGTVRRGRGGRARSAPRRLGMWPC